MTLAAPGVQAYNEQVYIILKKGYITFLIRFLIMTLEKNWRKIPIKYTHLSSKCNVAKEIEKESFTSATKIKTNVIAIAYIYR